MIIHAGLIARRVGGGWRGALIQGPSGVGKSDLALRALDAGFALAADDRTLLFVSGGALFGRAPGPLRGLIEVRGVGILRQTALPFAPVWLSVRCKTSPSEIDRSPEARLERLLGIEIPTLDLWPLENSAPAKIGRAIETLGARSQGAYQGNVAPPCRRVGAWG
jgi:serine kinase of HPr protein (carbohydrate metabolism regulator)